MTIAEKVKALPDKQKNEFKRPNIEVEKCNDQFVGLIRIERNFLLKKKQSRKLLIRIRLFQK